MTTPTFLDFTNARLTIERLTTHTDKCNTDDPYRKDDEHDIAGEILRDLLIDPNELDEEYWTTENLRREYTLSDADATLDFKTIWNQLKEAVQTADAYPYGVQYMSELRLHESLCPVHHIDYASCFDDDDPECALIRQYFPNHDT